MRPQIGCLRNRPPTHRTPEGDLGAGLGAPGRGGSLVHADRRGPLRGNRVPGVGQPTERIGLQDHLAGAGHHQPDVVVGPRCGPNLFRPMISAPMPRPQLLAKASSTPVLPPGWPCIAWKVRVPKNHCCRRSPACPKGASRLCPHQCRIRPATQRSYGHVPATWRISSPRCSPRRPGQGAQPPHPAPVRTNRRARTHRHADYGTQPAAAARAGRARSRSAGIWPASPPSAGLRLQRPNGASCAARAIGPRATPPMTGC